MLLSTSGRRIGPSSPPEFTGLRPLSPTLQFPKSWLIIVKCNLKENAYSQLYEELKVKEGRKKIYKLANARKRMATDIGRVTAVKDKDGTLLTGDDEVKGRWLGYFDDLLNIENERGFRRDSTSTGTNRRNLS